MNRQCTIGTAHSIYFPLYIFHIELIITQRYETISALYLKLYICSMDLIYTLGQIDQIAAQLVKKYGSKTVWVFQAPMGAGKTTLIAAIGKALGIQQAMSSPTFSIMNQYEVHGKLIYHMDWYRLETEAEARQAGVEAAMDEADISLVEWPEKAPSLVPEDAVVLNIEILDPGHRRIFVSSIK